MKIFNSDEIQFIYFSLVACVFGVVERIPCPIQSYENLFLSSSNSFNSLTPICSSLIHFELIFLYSVR